MNTLVGFILLDHQQGQLHPFSTVNHSMGLVATAAKPLPNENLKKKINLRELAHSVACGTDHIPYALIQPHTYG